MSKVKYKFNKKSLQFEVVKHNFRTIALKTLSYLATGAVFSFVVIFLAYTFLDSPKERILKREIEQYQLQFQMINERIAQYDAVLSDLADRDDNIYRVIFEAEPVSNAVRKAGFGGTDRYSKLEGYKNSEIIINTIKKLDKVHSQLAVQSKSFDEVFNMAKNKTEMLSCIPAIQPLNNKDLRRLSSYYGYRTDPIYKVKKFHPGIDFSAPNGTPIYATGDGVVTEVIKANSGYGNTIVIDHGYGYETMYAHIYQFKVKQGEKVKRGQQIATIGSSGKSTAPHLHYEIWKNGNKINPIYFFFNDLTPEEYETVLELSTRQTQSMD
jgi:murein DD-endopeptidase MepM/ murein hydrolase activator NlpD